MDSPPSAIEILTNSFFAPEEVLFPYWFKLQALSLLAVLRLERCRLQPGRVDLKCDSPAGD